MDGKPLLQDRPPPYSPYGPPPGNYAPHTYGTIPPAPPYPFPPGTTGPGYTAPASSQPHNYPNTTYTIIQQPPPTTSVIVVGGCPACRVGVLEDTFTCLGILCAIVFFPVGIIFCLALRQRTCPNCGATFG
ncbi:brain protein I3 [Pseudonaja textilis]|uniref:Membrane protein BRI3 n=2 Tax=Elapidae TaxID=8602 RepID=A0A670XQ92_PSETE|nr:brain protein I3 [Pseudonaja textilis]